MSTKTKNTDESDEAAPSSSSSSTNELTKTPIRFIKDSVDIDATATDWYGNMPLHHAVSRTPDKPNLDIIRLLLALNPSAASAPNQFGRLPLHYALDRCRADLDVVRVLQEAYPYGARVAALDNVTPYDLAMKWQHSNDILWLLLKDDPDIDPKRYFALKYGSVLGFLFSAFFGAAAVNVHVTIRPLGTYDEEEEQRELDNDDEDEDDDNNVNGDERLAHRLVDAQDST